MDRAKNGGFEALTSLYKAGVFIIAFPWRFWGKSGWKSLKQVKKGRQAEREVGNISFFSKSTLYQTYCYVFSGQANGWRVVFPLNAFRICMLLYLHLCLLWKSGSLSEMRGDRRREKLKFGANYISAQQCLLQNWHFKISWISSLNNVLTFHNLTPVIIVMIFMVMTTINWKSSTNYRGDGLACWTKRPN